ncbi:hypothetical protein J2X04_001145 [Lysobacter niabensis]|uniref:Uncharacterized protein n=1 Tax=Agrilutibacter niabensis TaxID=380628 RepID=A0ABU1VNG3_9GAMM|nr:hypothetical protein [Lysobacter niabensis]MDR7098798.1 hypothetical protein [Lysobacter niabensis]
MKSRSSALALVLALACAPAWSAGHSVARDSSNAQEENSSAIDLERRGTTGRGEFARHAKMRGKHAQARKKAGDGAKRDPRSLPIVQLEVSPWNFE